MNPIPRDQQPTNPSFRRSAQGPATKFSVTAGLLYGGMVFAALSLFLPWTTVTTRVLYGSSGTVDASPFRGAWIFVILLVIASAGWLAWPTVSGAQMLVKRLGALTGVVGLLGVFFVVGLVNYANGLSEKREAVAEAGAGFGFLVDGIEVSLGFGFVLYAAALVAIAAGLGLVWRQRLTARKTLP